MRMIERQPRHMCVQISVGLYNSNGGRLEATAAGWLFKLDGKQKATDGGDGAG